jgi:glyoxylase-like metal-dependent hydrolase (beta-lactamase superfamily II)
LVKIEIFPMGVFQVNSYLLACEKTGKIVVVDPGDEPEILLRRLDQLKAQPVAILNTHGHVDHVAGNAAIQREFAIPSLLHPADRFLVETFPAQAAMFGLDLESPPPPDGELVPGETFAFGECTLRILHTPGHSPGSVTLVHENDAISGDVLFADSIGRTDLPQGDLPTLLRSIDDVLVPLGDEMRIHPGHGPQTTIARERRSNPFLRKEWRQQLLRSVA